MRDGVSFKNEPRRQRPTEDRFVFDLAPLMWHPCLALMLIVQVQAQVKPECVEAFKAASEENARASVREAGIAQFDVIQQEDDPCRFLLIEVYRTPDAPARHKETAHYAKWRDTVASMMAAPRSSLKYRNVFPADDGWIGRH